MTTEQNEGEISSLIRLLDDRDPFVRDRVRDRLIELGGEAVPFLEMAMRQEDLERRRHLMDVLERIAPMQLAEAFQALTQTQPGQDIDLMEGVLLIMRYGHPEADAKQVVQAVDDLAFEFFGRLDDDDPPENVVRNLAQFLFVEKGFGGNKEDYFNPNNSYFDTVLSGKKGIPISLSVLCILIGQRLHLPIVGVGLPGHFIAKYNTLQDPVYFDPFNQGRIVTPETCAELVKSFGMQFEETFLMPVNHREILIRMLHNLIMIYNRSGDEDRAEQLTEYSKILMKRKPA